MFTTNKRYLVHSNNVEVVDGELGFDSLELALWMAWALHNKLGEEILIYDRHGEIIVYSTDVDPHDGYELIGQLSLKHELSSRQFVDLNQLILLDQASDEQNGAREKFNKMIDKVRENVRIAFNEYIARDTD